MSGAATPAIILRLPAQDAGPWPMLGWLAAGGLGAALGAMVGLGLALYAAALLLFGVAILVGLVNWRWSVYALIAYLPVSGIPIIALYPHSASAALIKDFAFVIPAYAGFFGSRVLRREGITFPGVPLITGFLFAAIVLVEAANPRVPSPLVAAIGIKVWLFYLPMILLGYHLIESRNDLGRLLALMSISAIVPTLLGIIEAGLVYSGHASTVYGWYGGAASAATQGFAVLSVGGAQISRIPSTFSFAAQYLVYLTCMVAVTYGWWRGGFRPIRVLGIGVSPRLVAPWALGALLLAAFLSGSRGAFVLVPLILLLAVTLELRRGLMRAIGIAVAVLIGLSVAIGVYGASPVGLVSAIGGHATDQFKLVFTGGLSASAHISGLGLGTGSETNAARYVLPDPAATLTSVGGVRQESWFVKTLVELGVLGLVLLLALLVASLGPRIRDHFNIRDPGLRSISAALIALLVVQTAYNVKAQYPDIDPLNVYFWLFVGLLVKISALDRDAAVEPASSSRGNDGASR